MLSIIFLECLALYVRGILRENLIFMFSIICLEYLVLYVRGLFRENVNCMFSILFLECQMSYFRRLFRSWPARLFDGAPHVARLLSPWREQEGDSPPSRRKYIPVIVIVAVSTNTSSDASRRRPPRSTRAPQIAALLRRWRLSESLAEGNPFKGEIPCKGESLINNKFFVKGESIIQGNPL